MLINGKHFPQKGCNLRYAGCSCHNTKQSRRRVKHAAKQQEKRQWKRDSRSE